MKNNTNDILKVGSLYRERTGKVLFVSRYDDINSDYYYYYLDKPESLIRTPLKYINTANVQELGQIEDLDTH